MSTKSCPSCSAEVPNEALRCKHCFHDFNAEPEKKNSPLPLLFLLATIALMGLGTFTYIHKNNAAERIVVDQETESIVITRKTASETTTNRVPFANVEKVEHVMGGKKAMFEVVAVTTSGERVLLKQSDDKPQQGHAEHMARVMDKPYVEVRNIKTFGD
jgi:hypothetical protein